jgi:general stress protein YciG
MNHATQFKSEYQQKCGFAYKRLEGIKEREREKASDIGRIDRRTTGC